MTARSLAYCLFVSLMLVAGGSLPAHAQRFSVASFKPLTNDVSAFINPVRDLNDEACGLVKVIASEDFVFSTPLGIVKRIDKTGEIWLYLPRGSKKITLKHADWGVLRDYVFPVRIDSHMSYELRVDEPVAPLDLKNAAPAAVTVVRDTMVLTRVDTLVVSAARPDVPFCLDAVATISFGGRNGNVMGGVLLTAMKRHGAFVHAATDFGRIGRVEGECGKNGETDGSIPFYSGHTRKSAFMINAGLVHRLSGSFAIYEGAGYASSSLAWQLAQSEGGGYLKNTHYSVSGVSFEAGVLFAYKRIVATASVATIKGKEWYGSVGVGIKIGK